MAVALDISRHRAAEWPANGKALSTQLRRYEPNLRRSGIEVQRLGRHNDGWRVRITRYPTDEQAEKVNVLATG